MPGFRFLDRLFLCGGFHHRLFLSQRLRCPFREIQFPCVAQECVTTVDQYIIISELKNILHHPFTELRKRVESFI